MPVELTTELRDKLVRCYEELMWLAKRPDVTPERARAWYSAVRNRQFTNKIREFTGKVSKRALRDVNDKLVLEHYKRIDHTLSELLTKHCDENLNCPDEFVETILSCEIVNITTEAENRYIQDAEGDYKKADITLVPWDKIDEQRRKVLWNRKLRGKVANAADFQV